MANNQFDDEYTNQQPNKSIRFVNSNSGGVSKSVLPKYADNLSNKSLNQML